MHILAEQIRSLDESVPAVDLGQSPAEIVFLSFTDSDLSLAALAYAQLDREVTGQSGGPNSSFPHPEEQAQLASRRMTPEAA